MILLPYPDSTKCAQVLSLLDLEEQRRKGRSAVRYLESEDPQARIPLWVSWWSGCDLLLRQHVHELDVEWRRRGRKRGRARRMVPEGWDERSAPHALPRPWWWGDARVHESHQRAMAYYSQDDYPPSWEAHPAVFMPNMLKPGVGVWYGSPDGRAPAYWRNRFN